MEVCIRACSWLARIVTEGACACSKISTIIVIVVGAPSVIVFVSVGDVGPHGSLDFIPDGAHC